MKHADLTSHEIKVLEMLAGTREAEWGAWVSACLETLTGAGFCTHGPSYQITPAGLRALQESDPAPVKDEP